MLSHRKKGQILVSFSTLVSGSELNRKFCSAHIKFVFTNPTYTW